jgi:hypothetical protein
MTMEAQVIVAPVAEVTWVIAPSTLLRTGKDALCQGSAAPGTVACMQLIAAVNRRRPGPAGGWPQSVAASDRAANGIDY